MDSEVTGTRLCGLIRSSRWTRQSVPCVCREVHSYDIHNLIWSFEVTRSKCKEGFTFEPSFLQPLKKV